MSAKEGAGVSIRINVEKTGCEHSIFTTRATSANLETCRGFTVEHRPDPPEVAAILQGVFLGGDQVGGRKCIGTQPRQKSAASSIYPKTQFS